MEDFFKERWEQKADEEVGEHIDEEIASPETESEHYERTEGVKIYKEIEKQSAHDDATRSMFSELNKSILRYYRAILDLQRARHSNEDREEVSEADKNRRVNHDLVIGDLNTLSRYVDKQGLDNEWRRMVGLDRKQVTDWVKNVAPYISNKRKII